MLPVRSWLCELSITLRFLFNQALNICSQPPFTLSKEDAHIEAEKLVSSKQVWIHKLNRKVVSIAAFTRNTRQVATITKVTAFNTYGIEVLTIYLTLFLGLYRP